MTPVFEVVVVLTVRAMNDSEATSYVQETIRDIAERDFDGPGADGTTDEPWLMGGQVRASTPSDYR